MVVKREVPVLRRLGMGRSSVLCCWRFGVVRDLNLEALDFRLELFKLNHLALEKARGQRRLGGNARRREQIGVREFSLAALKVVHLEQPLVEQRFEAIVGFAQTHAEFTGQLALVHARICFKQAQHLKMNAFCFDNLYDHRGQGRYVSRSGSGV